MPGAPERLRPRWRLVAAVAVALATGVLGILLPAVRADPPPHLSISNAPYTDEGFNLINARNDVFFGRFADDDFHHELTNGLYSGAVAAVFRVTGPRLSAGRAVSVLCVAVTAALLVLGLSGLLGALAAALSGLAYASSELVLDYGRLGFVESMLSLLLVGMLLAIAWLLERRKLWLGAAAGLLYALAISVKGTAVVPGAAMLAVAVAVGWRRRDRAILRGLVAAAVAFTIAALAWFLVIAMPNLARLRIAVKILGGARYPDSATGVPGQLWRYLHHADHAFTRSAPVLAAAGVGLLVLVLRRGGVPGRVVPALGLAFGASLWLAIALGSYAPNRYVLPALAGLGVPAGAGTAWLATRIRRGGPVLAAALAVGLATPGVAAAVSGELASTGQLANDQRTLGALVPDGATVFGQYSPTMFLDRRVRTIVPWPTAHANVRDPLHRFGVGYLLSDGTQPQVDRLVMPDPRSARLLAKVRWGPHVLALYRLAR